jgi:phage/plasmid-like protein (TIGR03299 family)
MAHELEINAEGTANAFLVGQPAWHNLGTVLDNPPSVAEAIKLAGLDYPIVTVPLQAQVGPFGLQGLDTGYKALVLERTVNGHIERDVLSVVSDTYEPVQNSEVFEFFQPAIEAGYCSFESAGSLYGGKRVWALARINGCESDVVAGDPIKSYFLLVNSHDGTKRVTCGGTDIRVVCANTEKMATGRGSEMIKIKHTKGVHVALDQVRNIVDFQKNRFEATLEQMRALARVGVDSVTLAKYVREVFEPEILLSNPKEHTRDVAYARLLSKIIPAFEGVGAAGRGNNLPGVRGTLWGAFNAVTGYLNHDRGHGEVTRLESLWFGTSQKTTVRALEVASRMAA